MTTHKHATPDHPIHELIARRWSPYAFADRPVSDDDRRSLFEAARWAASSCNFGGQWGHSIEHHRVVSPTLTRPGHAFRHC